MHDLTRVRQAPKLKVKVIFGWLAEQEITLKAAKNVAVWSKRMKELRDANNLVQADVAKVLDCTQVAYGMYELGKRRISIENLVKLARYYHVSLDYLVGLRDQA